MQTGKGRVVELLLEDECRYARISCPEALIPGPGQYLLASSGSDSILPVPIFYTDSTLQGFIGLASSRWKPGDLLDLRGPLGHGFSLPGSARRVGLVAFEGSPARLRGLVEPSLRQDASVVLVCDSYVNSLADEVEIQPISALSEILHWADFAALDVSRENLGELLEKLNGQTKLPAWGEIQILIHTPMPCGGLAECGVCALTTKSDWKLVCREGPVFDLGDI